MLQLPTASCCNCGVTSFPMLPGDMAHQTVGGSTSYGLLRGAGPTPLGAGPSPDLVNLRLEEVEVLIGETICPIGHLHQEVPVVGVVGRIHKVIVLDASVGAGIPVEIER